LRVSQKIVACLQLRSNAPSSASAAEATTNCKMEQRVKKAPLSLIELDASGFQPIKKWPHARLWALALER
jgi:hypothetical protein